MRSDTVKKGIQQAPHRSLFNALGLTEEELDRPLIGVVSSYNEIVPGHMNLDKITEAVKLMSHSKSFCRICDQVSCYKRIFHTDMSHSNTITDSNCRNHDWCSSGHCHAKFNGFCDLIQIHVSRYNRHYV